MDMTTREGMGTANLWRTGSAAAHGYYWTDTTRDNAGQFDEESFRPRVPRRGPVKSRGVVYEVVV